MPKTETHQRKTEPARGQSLVELTLALPALLILFLGAIEVALALRAQLVLTNANREAARYASHGAFSNEQVVERAKLAFSHQLPIELSGPDANLGILITRFYLPADVTATTSLSYSTYFTGTENYANREGDIFTTTSKVGALEEYARKIEEKNESYLTTNEVVIVETWYHHHQLLDAPLIRRWIPEPIILYMRTAMRISGAHTKPKTQE